MARLDAIWKSASCSRAPLAILGSTRRPARISAFVAAHIAEWICLSLRLLRHQSLYSRDFLSSAVCSIPMPSILPLLYHGLPRGQSREKLDAPMWFYTLVLEPGVKWTIHYSFLRDFKILIAVLDGFNCHEEIRLSEYNGRAGYSPPNNRPQLHRVSIFLFRSL